MSELIAEIDERNRISFPNSGSSAETHHWIVPTKETTIEVVAESLEVHRSSAE